MENEPTISFQGKLTSITMYENEDGVWVITDHTEDVTTQGESKYEALLMLADALAAVNEDDVDLVETAEDVFTLDKSDEEFLEELQEN